MKPKTYKFLVDYPSEYAAGIRGFVDKIMIVVDSGDIGGEEGEFEKYMVEVFNEWFGGINCTTLNA